MKKSNLLNRFIKLLVFTWFVFSIHASYSQYICCPKFKVDIPEICTDSNACRSTFASRIDRACKGTATKYTVLPVMPGFTYTWTVIGGTSATPTGNPMVINWGSGTNAYFKVVISNASGTCQDSIERLFCMVDAPKANFNFSSPICNTTPVIFNNTSVGANTYVWDFGDGTVYAGNILNPTHVYNTPGTYIVCLTASNVSSSGSASGLKCSGCIDTKCDTIIVTSGVGPNISIVSCRGSFCSTPSPTIQFTTTSTCSPLIWSIPAGAGTILNPGGNPVNIQWNSAFTGTPTVTLSIPASCSGSCPASTMIEVPIIYPSLPVTGPNPVCIHSISAYSIPVLPGCYYNATLTNSGAIASFTPSTNTYNSNTISVNAGPIGGNFTVTFTYYDSIKKCGGTATKTVTVKPKFTLIPPSGDICDKDNLFVCATAAANWTVDSLGITVATFTNLNCIPTSGLNPGIYTLIAVPFNLTLFCNASEVTTIRVLPNPTISTTMQLVDTFCSKDIATYHVSSNVPSSPYTWSITGSGNSVLSNDDSTVTVRWNIPGTLSVFQTNPCNSDTIIFISDTFKAPVISGPTAACEDDIVTYTVAPVNLPYYTFNATYGSIISQSGNTVTVMWAGRTGGGHQIQVNSCSGSSVLSVAVSSAGTPSVSLLSFSCNAATIQSSLSGAAPYVWYLNGILQPSFITQTIVAPTNGYWMCKPTGCFKKSGIAVNIPAPPILNITTPVNRFCVGSASVSPIIFYSALSLGATPPITYQWYGPATNYASPTSFGASGTAATYSPTGFTRLGNYHCIVTYGSGCTVTSNTMNIDTICPSPCVLPSAPYSVSSISSSCSGGGKSYTATLSSAPPSGTTISWTFGDGSGAGPTSIATTTSSTTHSYSLPGVYQVCCKISNASYCDVVFCRIDTVTFVPNFFIKKTCSGDSLFNTTQVLAGFTISSITWTAGAGTTISSTTANPNFATGNGNITLSVILGPCTNTIVKPITTPSTTVAISGLPARVCKGIIVPGITTSPAASNYSIFSWTFGDGTTSNIEPTQHAWNTSGTFTVNLSVTDNLGCAATGSASIIVDTLPKVVLNNDSFICKGSPFSLVATSGYTNYQWYNFPPSFIASTGAINTLPVISSGMYVVSVTNGQGCTNTSNIVTIIVRPLPKIKFNFQNGQIICINASGGVLPISTIYDIKYTYAWSSDDPTNISFVPPGVANTNISVTAAISIGFHQIYLTVIDTSTGCKKTDTVCVFIQRKPSVSIAPAGPFCAGSPVTLIPTPNNPALFNYLWSTGAATSIITVSLPGTYSVVIDSMGCSSFSSNSITINPRPNLELFPRGCDTICDTAHLYIPLPNNLSYPPPPGVYPIINWWIDGTTIISGPYLYLTSISLGSHTIQVIVTNNFGCTDTSKIYNIFVKHCDSVCPPCFKDSCCNAFLDSMKNKTIGVNYSTSPLIVFTPPVGLLATDIVQWDFNCDGIVDATTMGAATASYNYFSVGTYYACVKVIRPINTATQRDTCYANFTKKIGIEKQQSNPCEFCNNLFVNVNITDNCAVVGDRSRTAIAYGGSGLYIYRWYNTGGTLLSTGSIYAGALPCYCIVYDNVTGCYDTSGTDWYRDISSCVPNTVADNRCTNFKLTITKSDGPVTGDVYLTMYASNGSGNHSFFWYGYPAGGGPVITSGPTTIVSQTTSALTSGPMAMVIKVRDLTWGCEANDSFFLVDKICKNSGIASLAESDVNVFPNPTSSKIYVELTDRMKLKNSKISFIDQLGRIVKEVSVPIPNSTIEIDIESFDRGIYFMVIKNRDEKVILYKKVSKD